MQALKFGPSYLTSDVGWDAQRTVNLIPEVDESGDAKAGLNLRLVTAPGQDLEWVDANLVPRAFCKLPTGLYIVVCQNVSANLSAPYIYNPITKTVTLIPKTNTYPNGPAVTGDGWLSWTFDFTSRAIRMAFNGKDLMIVDEGYDMIKVTLVDPMLPGYFWDYARDSVGTLPYYPTDVTFIGGYFVIAGKLAGEQSSDKFYLSGLYSADIDPLDVATAEYKADGIRAVAALQGSLWLFGRASLEVWAHTGAVSFPFERIMGVQSDSGCRSMCSVQQVSDSLFWLATTASGSLYIAMTQGYTPIRVSTTAIDTFLAAADEVGSSLTSFAYSYGGHYFYGINLVGIGTTLVYDLSTKMWHERTRYDPSISAQKDVGYSHTTTQLSSEELVIHPNWTGIYKLNHNSPIFQTSGTPTGHSQTCERSFPIVADASGNRVRHDEVQLDAALATGEVTQPSYTLQWSDNSGRTFSSGRTLQPADVGEYNERFIWRRLGVSRTRLYKLTFTTRGVVSLRSMMLEASKLNA